MKNKSGTDRPLFAKRIFKILLYVFFLFFVLFSAGEITLRVIGFQALNSKDKKTEVSPGGWLFLEDNKLGYRMRPGILKITIDDKISFRASHDRLGRRICTAEPDSANKPEIWFFGCSFSYGWGVNDEETFPALIQKKFPDKRILNFACPGYGTVQSFLQLEDALAASNAPEKIILAFGGFHNQRNVCSDTWKHALNGQKIMEGMRYPFMRIDDSSDLVKGWSDLHYSPYGLSKWFALVNFAEVKINEKQEAELKAEEVTEKLIKRMKMLADAKGSEFILAGIYKDEGTTHIINKFSKLGWKAKDVSLELTDGEILFQGDNHPNAEGHRILAEGIQVLLEN